MGRSEEVCIRRRYAGLESEGKRTTGSTKQEGRKIHADNPWETAVDDSSRMQPMQPVDEADRMRWTLSWQL